MIDDMRTMRVRTQADFAERRDVAIPHVQVSGTDIASANTVLTVRARAQIKLQRLSVVNTTGSAATLTLHAVPDGGSAGAGNLEISQQSVPANGAVSLFEVMGGFYDAGTSLVAFSGTTNALVVHGWAEEIL